MIKKNNLSLKTLQAQIEAMQAQNITPKAGIVTRISKMAGTPFMFIFSTLLAYGHKLPFIKKIISILSLWYGRTPWWKMLIHMRKAFMVFNALIGVFTVLNITGFSFENFMASCYMLGLTYFEMFSLGIGRIFSWFYNLFDKITPYPSVPSNPPSKPKFYKIPYISTGEIPPKPSYPNLGPSSVSWTVEDFLNPKKNESSGWNMPSWVWYAAIAALTIGAAYLGYQVVTSDQFRDWLAPHHKNTNTGSLDPNTVPLPPSPESFDTPSSGLFSTIGKKIYSFNKSITDALNPFNYFGTERDAYAAKEAYLLKQSTINTLDMSKYPYTLDNPLDSTLKRWLTYYFGESKVDALQRTKDQAVVSSWYEAIRIRNLPNTPGFATPGYQPGPGTLNPGEIGFQPSFRGTQSSWYDAYNNAVMNARLSKLGAAVLSTNTEIPGANAAAEWSSHSRGPSIDLDDVPSSSKITLEGLKGKGKATESDYLKSLAEVWGSTEDPVTPDMDVPDSSTLTTG